MILPERVFGRPGKNGEHQEKRWEEHRELLYARKKSLAEELEVKFTDNWERSKLQMKPVSKRACFKLTFKMERNFHKCGRLVILPQKSTEHERGS